MYTALMSTAMLVLVVVSALDYTRTIDAMHAEAARLRRT
jgi:hypothetical protein